MLSISRKLFTTDFVRNCSVRREILYNTLKMLHVNVTHVGNAIRFFTFQNDDTNIAHARHLKPDVAVPVQCSTVLVLHGVCASLIRNVLLTGNFVLATVYTGKHTSIKQCAFAAMLVKHM